MKKRLFKSILSILLVLTITFSMTAIATTSTSAAFVADYVLTQVCDKLVDLGLRGACMACDAIADSVDDEGTKEVVSTIEHILFMSPEEVATAQCIELCEEILDELNTLKTNMSDYSAVTNSLITQSQANEQYVKLKEKWASNVEKVVMSHGFDNIIGNYHFYEYDYDEGKYIANYNDRYMNYLETAKEHAGKSNNAEVKSAKAAFENAILSDVYGGYGDTSAMYKSNIVNQKFESTIKELSDNLVTADCVSGYATQYAMYSYPFSHQQYEYMVTMTQAQLMVLIELEFAYQEFLAMQSDYLTSNGISTIKTNNGDVTFEAIKDRASNCMFGENGAIKKIIDMLDAKRTVFTNGGQTKLSLNDYMKPEDVASVNMEIKDYKESIDYSYKLTDYMNRLAGKDVKTTKSKFIKSTVKFNRVMSYSGNSAEVYYILDPNQFYLDSNQSDDPLKAEHLYHYMMLYDYLVFRDYYLYMPSCDYMNITQKEITDGANSFRAVSNNSVEDLNGLFLTWPFYAYSGCNPSTYLGSYLPAPNTYIATSGFRFPDGDDVINTSDKHGTDFYLIEANKAHSGTKLEVSYLDSDQEENEFKANNKYSVILTNQSDVYKQNVHLSVDEHTADAKIITGDTEISNGKSVAVQSGKELTIKVKPEEEYTIKSIKCIRNNDVYENDSDAKTETVLLDEGDVDMYTPDENGYYTITYPMPYSDATFVVETKATPLEKDENGNFIIRTYLNLCTMSQNIDSGMKEFVNGHYIVVNDITAPSDSVFNPAGGFILDKYVLRVFKGTFDGQNHTISNLTIDDYNQVGLFGYNEGTIKNIKLNNCRVKAEHTAGGICGTNEGTIINASVNATVNSANCIGVICGDNRGLIKDCTSLGQVNCTGDGVGGICGQSIGEITSCTNYADIQTDTNWAGGVCGSNSGTITNSCNHGTIQGNQYVGGVSGISSNSISDCYNTGDVSGIKYVNPISYQDRGKVNNCYYLNTSETDSDEGTTFKTAVQFKSGEVTYLLNRGVTNGTQVWYQNVDYKEPFDEYPHFEKTENNTVYKINTEDKMYSNILSLIGDADLDSKVSIMDATLIQKHCAQLYEITGVAFVNADTTRDNTISISDATKIQAYIAGILEEL